MRGNRVTGGGYRVRLILSASAALIALTAGVAHAQQPPPPPSPPAPSQSTQPAPPAAEPAADSEEIVVLAQPGDQVQIDRRTYTLRQDPAAQSTNMFEVLGKIPSVSVAPSGAVTLLGAENVTIQINGQPVPGQNLEQVLRGLQGSDVERIEVITNPSAQYSAQASGGIINIITRQRFNAGLNGTFQAGYDNFNSYHAGISPSWSQGPWSLSGQVGVFGGHQENDFRRTRNVFSSGATTTEEGAFDVGFEGWYLGRLTVGYRPNPKRRMSVALDGVDVDNTPERRTVLSDSVLGPIATTSQNTDVDFHNGQLIFDFQQDGAQPRELLKFNAALQNNGFTQDALVSNIPTVGVSSIFRSEAAQETDSLTSRLDYERPFADERFLTAGLAFDMSRQDIDNARTTIAGPPATPDFAAQLDGRQQTLAAYATFQFATGDWTWQPGVRAENYRREVFASGLESDTNDLRWFPSIHVRTEFGPDINVDLSYSSRIQRPGFQQLDPSLRFFDVNRAQGGNPNLDPTTTDAYEANFTWQSDGRTFSLTFYDRISDDIVSPFTQTTGGVIITRPVNAGTSEQRGLQAMLRGPINENWRYSLTANLLSREFDVLSSGGALSRDEAFEYDGVASIDYRDRNQDAVGADQLQLELRFQGPRHTLQSDIDQFVVANMTWRRKITPKLYATLTAQDIFGTQDQLTETTTADYFERTEFLSPGPRVRLGISYQFGNGPQRPPQDQQPPGFGGPQIPQQ